MENMSKALIIAGAVIASILVISLGIAIYSNVKRGADSQAFTDEERNIFNSQFLPYTDQEMFGTEAKTVIQKVVSSNQNHKDDNRKYITLRFNGTNYAYNAEHPDIQANNLSRISRTEIIDNALYHTDITFNKFGLVGIIEIK